MQHQKTTDNNRRNFLKQALLASAASVAGPGLARAAEHFVTDKEIFHSRHIKHDVGNGYTILFQGDSITDGGRTNDTDLNHFLGSGYVYLISSALWYQFPKKKFHFINRGVSGNTITDLTARWQSDTIDLKPDVLSILVGVNDVAGVIFNSSQKMDSKQFEDKYRSLLQQTLNQLPNVQLVLCTPFILPVGIVKDRYAEWLNEIQQRQAVVLKLSKEFDAIYIDFQDIFYDALKKAPADYWIWDGVHPLPAGHQMMADYWTEKVHQKLSYIKMDEPFS